MKKCGNKVKKLVSVFVSMVLVLSVFCVSAYGHSGGTDSNGGHTDHSTGEYHYHHGHPAHQHENGVCPYDQKETTISSNDYDYSSESQTISSNIRTYGYKTVDEARELLLNEEDIEVETSEYVSYDTSNDDDSTIIWEMIFVIAIVVVIICIIF